MINASEMVSSLTARGYTFFTGVPCSFLKPMINQVINCADLCYIGASNEGEAVGIAAGSHLASKTAVVMMQNSGLGNIVNPVTSLTNIYKIPCLFIIALRGEPELHDAVQHEIMGKITHELLELLGIQYEVFPSRPDEIDSKIQTAHEYLSRSSVPIAFVLKKGSVEEYNPVLDLKKTNGRTGIVLNGKKKVCEGIKRKTAIFEVAINIGADDLLISTTGKISRELFYCADRPANFYMQGSMGCAASIGLGLAINQQKKVIVLDGDGAVLMKMGTLATIGYYQPQKFLHIILDNQSYDTTGGQPTVSSNVSFPKIAIACGYKRAVTAVDLQEFVHYIQQFLHKKGPSLIHFNVEKGAEKNLGRPSLTPEEIKERFMEAVHGRRWEKQPVLQSS